MWETQIDMRPVCTLKRNKFYDNVYITVDSVILGDVEFNANLVLRRIEFISMCYSYRAKRLISLAILSQFFFCKNFELCESAFLP